MKPKLKKIDFRGGLLGLLAFLPLLIRVIEETITSSEVIIYANDNKVYTDIFYHIKARYLYGVVILMAVVMIYDLWKKNIGFKGIFKRLITYVTLGMAVLIIMSTVGSAYQDIAYFGIFQRYEGLFTLLAYLMVMVYAAVYITPERLSIFGKGVVVSTILISGIGLLQAVGYDLFTKIFFQVLYFPPRLVKYINAMNIKTNIGVYSTLFNPNYVGSYATIVLPVLIMTARKSIGRWRVASWISTGMVLSLLLAARSSAGLLALILSGVFYLVIDYRSIASFRLKKEHKRILLVSIMLVAVVFSGTFLSFFRDMTSPISTSDERVLIRGIVFDKEWSILDFDNGTEVKIKLNSANSAIFYDQDDEILSFSYDEVRGIGWFNDPDYDFIKFMYFRDNIIGFAFNVSDKVDTLESSQLLLVKVRYLNSYLINQNGYRIDITEEIPRFELLDGYEMMGSSRGYIWSRSIPILKETLIIGKGPDSFIMEFPQDDVIGKHNYMYRPGIVVDKAHNMYLAMGIHTGILSLLLFLILILVVGIRALRIRRVKKVVVPLLVGGFAFCVASFFNDSVVSVTPLFYLYLGALHGFADSAESDAMLP